MPFDSNKIFRVRELSLIYGSKDSTNAALSNVTLDIMSGQITALVGPSGSGKSSLLRCLCGLMSPTSGDIFYRDFEVTRLPSNRWTKLRRDEIHIVTQQVSLIPYLTIWENVELVLPKGDVEQRDQARALLKNLNLQGMCDKFPRQLSVGGRQRVTVIRALLNNPKVILMDEPTAALDVANAQAVMDVLRSRANEGVAIVMATHDFFIEQLADVVHFLRDGKQVSVNDRSREENTLASLELNNAKVVKTSEG